MFLFAVPLLSFWFPSYTVHSPLWWDFSLDMEPWLQILASVSLPRPGQWDLCILYCKQTNQHLILDLCTLNKLFFSSIPNSQQFTDQRIYWKVKTEKLKFHKKNEIEPKFKFHKKLNVSKNEMSSELNCHQNLNVTKTAMSPKLKLSQNWNLTKTEISPKIQC